VTGYLLRRLAASLLLVLLLVSLLFFLLHLAPGDPAELIADPGMPPEQHQRLVHLYGLDRPLGEQYLIWLSAVVLHWDWGTSFIHHRPAARVLAEALPATLLLATAALLVDYGLGLLFGVISARRRERAADHLIRGVSLFVFSMPTFWLALMAVLLFAYLWPLLPASHMHAAGADHLPWAARQADLLWHLVLPAAVLGTGSCGATIRLLRGSLLEALGQDYVRTARAKGLSERRVVLVHALRNAVVPLIQVFGYSFPALLNGSLVVEVIFSWPGVGRVLFTALNTNDYPLVLAGTALTGTLVVAGSFLADLLHAIADPRVRIA
jgi:peptide/nickel transport system permease protein